MKYGDKEIQLFLNQQPGVPYVIAHIFKRELYIGDNMKFFHNPMLIWAFDPDIFYPYLVKFYNNKAFL
jgi:hypothetical protein